MSTFITKFIITSGDVIYVKIEMKKPEEEAIFDIVIYNHEQHSWWMGTFDKKSALKYRLETDEGNEYLENVITCLKNTSIQKYNFELAPDLANNASTVRFTWKRTLDSNATLLHGSVQLYKVDNPKNTNDIIDFLLNENVKLKKQIDDNQLETLALKSELDEHKSTLEKLTNVKSSLENSMYGKFIRLLNSKKRRIHLLEEQL